MIDDLIEQRYPCASSLTSRSALLKKCRVAWSRAWASLRTMLLISLSRWNILMAPLKKASLNAENTTSGGLLRRHIGEVVIHDFTVDPLETDEVLACERRSVAVVERLDDLGEGALFLFRVRLCREFADRCECVGVAWVERCYPVFFLLNAERLKAKHVLGDLDVGRNVPVGQQAGQPVRVGIKLLKSRIAEPDDLRHKAVEAHVALQKLPELLLPALVVLNFEARDSMADEPFEARPVVGVERALIEGLGETVDLVLVEDAEGLETCFQLVNLIGIRVGLQARYLIIRFEGGLDVLDAVLEVEDVGTVLARIGPIETRERLHGL